MTPKSPLWFVFETLNSLEKGQDSKKVGKCPENPESPESRLFSGFSNS